MQKKVRNKTSWLSWAVSDAERTKNILTVVGLVASTTGLIAAALLSFTTQ